MDRRSFVQNLGGSLLLLMLNARCGSDGPRLDRERVVVVGAGAAGLYAAHLLKMRGARVTVLEAQDWPGGRIRALPGFAQSPIELGASYVHGSDNVLYELARANGVTLAEPSATYLVLDGVLRGGDEVESDPDVVAYYEIVQSLYDYRGPNITLDAYLRGKDVPPRIAHLLEVVGLELCASNDRIAMEELVKLAAAHVGSQGPSENLVPNRPYLSMFDGILAGLAADIRYNAAVQRIEYSGKGVFVTDAYGQTHEADRVVVTVPLGVLQRGAIEFSPPLPKIKLDAIQGLEFGAGMKVVLKFSERFWPEDLGLLGGTTVATAFWPAGGPEDRVFVAYVTGERAERLQGDRIVPTVLEELDGLFGSRRPSGALVDVYVMNWTAEPFFGGQFAYPLFGWRAMKEALAAPVGDRLFFAGEATNLGEDSESEPGTVHGAMMSAERAVQELIATFESV